LDKERRGCSSNSGGQCIAVGISEWVLSSTWNNRCCKRTLRDVTGKIKS